MPSAGIPAATRKNIYRASFIAHVHRLVDLGHRKMEGHDYSGADEETISGDLCEAIEQLLDAPDEGWMRAYSVQNERPVQQKHLARGKRTRKGKRRLQIDIHFVSNEASPRPGFSFEAKRLRDGRSAGAYTGPEGMGCFVDGRYARGDAAGGMLGYVQQGAPEEWAPKIQRRMGSRRRELGLPVTGRVWRDSGFEISGMPGKQSTHKRTGDLGELKIFHGFLDFRQC